MDHATCFRLLSATHFATSLLPLTVRLIPVLTEIGRLIVGFRRAELTPQVCHQFETQLHAQLRELGRIIVAWTFNHIEPRDRRDMPNQMYFQGVWYRRRSKTPKRTVATLFGTITLGGFRVDLDMAFVVWAKCGFCFVMMGSRRQGARAWKPMRLDRSVS